MGSALHPAKPLSSFSAPPSPALLHWTFLEKFRAMDWTNPKPDFTEHDLSTFDYGAVPMTEVCLAFMWKSDVDKVRESLQTFPPTQANHDYSIRDKNS